LGIQLHETGYQFRRFAGPYSDKALELASERLGGGKSKTGGSETPVKDQFW
jgi:hypothetical protein